MIKYIIQIAVILFSIQTLYAQDTMYVSYKGSIIAFPTSEIDSIIHYNPRPIIAKRIAEHHEKVQKQLNEGISVAELLQSEPIEMLLGKEYLGGYIFAITDSAKGNGLMIPKTHLGEMQWTPDRDIRVFATQRSLGMGYDNTDDIIRKYDEGAYAAYACDTTTLLGFDDWYLPTIEELEYIYKHVHLSDDTKVMGNDFWTSTEYTELEAYYFRFSYGEEKQLSKTLKNKVLPVRAF
jgi:hypothetical protein